VRFKAPASSETVHSGALVGAELLVTGELIRASLAATGARA
jgi:hypothetical protein